MILKNQSGSFTLEKENDLKAINWCINNGCEIVGTIESELPAAAIKDGFTKSVRTDLQRAYDKLEAISNIL